ncbi:MAG: hypothetical protein KME09_00095 [Pleurocapsa minor HA4230-MV1]|jgi:hypothetical protein|nr:hypothetical protein [Pleurocapsa minor HA4230-MV1]
MTNTNIAKNRESFIKSIFQNKLSQEELEFYTSASSIDTFNGEQLLWSNSQQKIFLIIKGSVRVKSDRGELITILNSGFVGLSHLFPKELWQIYKAYSTQGLQVLYLDLLAAQDIMEKFPAFRDYFWRSAIELNCVILHHYASAKDLSQRANLSSLVSALEELSFEQGVYNANILKKDKDFLILNLGDLIHTNGTELLPGKIYDCSLLPDYGEWVNNSGGTQVFYSQEANNRLLDQSKTKKLEASKEEMKQVDSINTIDLAVISKTELQSTKQGKSGKSWVKFKRLKRYLPFIYIFLFILSVFIIIIISRFLESR